MGPWQVSLRSCVVCSTRASKRELVRIVRDPAGFVYADPTGNGPGRGAYVCLKERCLNVVLKKKKLDYRLKVHIGQEDVLSLEKYFKNLHSVVNNNTTDVHFGVD